MWSITAWTATPGIENLGCHCPTTRRDRGAAPRAACDRPAAAAPAPALRVLGRVRGPRTRRARAARSARSSAAASRVAAACELARRRVVPLPASAGGERQRTERRRAPPGMPAIEAASRSHAFERDTSRVPMARSWPMPPAVAARVSTRVSPIRPTDPEAADARPSSSRAPAPARHWLAPRRRHRLRGDRRPVHPVRVRAVLPRGARRLRRRELRAHKDFARRVPPARVPAARSSRSARAPQPDRPDPRRSRCSCSTTVQFSLPEADDGYVAGPPRRERAGHLHGRLPRDAKRHRELRATLCKSAAVSAGRRPVCPAGGYKRFSASGRAPRARPARYS